MAALLSNKQAVAGTVRAARPNARTAVVVKAVQVNRRDMLGMIAVTAPLLASSPAMAGYGDSANVFGRVTNKSGFVPYTGENFAVLLPSKWNPSKEREFPGIVLRYEDNFDAVNNLTVLIQPSDKSNIESYGTPEEFLQQVSYLLGKQSYDGETVSEGGFAPNRVSAASVLDVGTETDKKGKTYYKFEILTRTGDGNEGGRHQLVKATVSNGQLYMLKVQAGDKRWFKGAKKECVGALDSFIVA